MKTLAIVMLALATAGAAQADKPTPEEARAAREAQKPATKGEVEGLRAQIAQLRAELRALRELVEKSATAGVAARPEVEPDDVAQAMRERRLAVGMTIDQANKALAVGARPKSGKLIGEEAGGFEDYEWDRERDVITATFQNGRLVRHERIEKQPVPRRTTSESGFRVPR
jgi:hypothetical protein